MPRVSTSSHTPDDERHGCRRDVSPECGVSDAERGQARRDIAHTVQARRSPGLHESLIDEETFNRILAVQLEDADLVVPESVVPE